MKELTEEQIKKQDSVDNAIYQLIQELNPADKSKVTFPVIPACRESFFGEVRDVIEDWMVERLKITDEQGFYAYLEENTEGEKHA